MCPLSSKEINIFTKTDQSGMATGPLELDDNWGSPGLLYYLSGWFSDILTCVMDTDIFELFVRKHQLFVFLKINYVF